MHAEASGAIRHDQMCSSDDSMHSDGRFKAQSPSMRALLPVRASECRHAHGFRASVLGHPNFKPFIGYFILAQLPPL